MGFFDQYKDYEYKKKLRVIVPAFILALGLNTVLFTEVGHNIQSSIVSYEGVETSHISVMIDTASQIGKVRVHQDMDDVKSIHLTLLYDDTTVIVDQIQSDLGSVSHLTQSVPQTLSVTFPQSIDLAANTDILTFSVVSLTPEPRTINISDTFFHQGDTRFELSSQGSGPF